MSVREYIGARYVPLFADPLTWDATRTYEPLTVVLYQGNSYTSRQSVPANIDIANTTYWAQTGNYNAQVEQYRQEVQAFDGRITANSTAISNEVTARQTADTSLSTAISNEETARQTADTSLSTAISNEETARQTADTALQAEIDAINQLGNVAIVGDSWSYMNNADQGWVVSLKNYATENGGNVYNYADPGCGFKSAGQIRQMNITQQINAISESVDKLIIFGGLNDVRDDNFNLTSFMGYVNTALNAALTKFPNKNIYLVCVNHGNELLKQKYLAAMSKMSEAATQLGIQAVDCVGWLPSSSLYNDSLHPNQAGHKIIYQSMLSILGLGNNVGSTKEMTVTLSQGTNIAIASDSEGNYCRYNRGCYECCIKLSGSVAANSTEHVVLIYDSDYLLTQTQPLQIGGNYNLNLVTRGYTVQSHNEIVLDIKNPTSSDISVSNFFVWVAFNV